MIGRNEPKDVNLLCVDEIEKAATFPITVLVKSVVHDAVWVGI